MAFLFKEQLLNTEKTQEWKLLSISGGFSELKVSTLERIFLRFTGYDLFRDKNASICSAAFSPDGKSIAFFMYIKHKDTMSFSDMGLFTVDADGKNLTAINKHLFPFCFAHSNYGGGISWSPDATQIAFIGKPEADYANKELDSFFSRTANVSPQDLYIVELKTRKTESLTVNNVRNIYSQAWSPDGRELCYVNTTGEVVIHNVVSNYSRKLSKGDYSSWSKDGRWIMFREGPAAEGRYFIMNPLASDRRLFCATQTKWLESPLFKPGVLVSSYPLWSPDGKCVLLSSVDTRSNNSTHYIVDLMTREFVKFENDLIFVSWEGGVSNA
jgi:Tol biopolymer transport system component